jgi:hypothetical protein
MDILDCLGQRRISERDSLPFGGYKLHSFVEISCEDCWESFYGLEEDEKSDIYDDLFFIEIAEN